VQQYQIGITEGDKGKERDVAEDTFEETVIINRPKLMNHRTQKVREPQTKLINLRYTGS
jgi:hypothetical protein